MRAVRLEFPSGRQLLVDVRPAGNEFVVRVADRELRVRLKDLGPGGLEAAVDGRRVVVFYARDRDTLQLHAAGRVYTFRRGDDRTAAQAFEPGEDVRAPMPGLVVRVLVEAGQRVEPGQPLYVVEAMKMETVVRAPRAARIRRVLAQPGQQVEGGTVVVELEDEPSPEARNGGIEAGASEHRARHLPGGPEEHA